VIKKLLISLLPVLASTAVHANLITNGDFEADIGSVASGGYTVVASGATTITGWSVSGSSVDLIRNAYGAPTSVAVDLHGTPGPGKLSQSFSVTAGTTYQLGFDLSGNGIGPHTILFDFGTWSESFTYSATSIQNIVRTYTAGTTGLATLSFQPVGGNDLFNGPVIDNVVVAAVPIPGTLALFGLGLLSVSARRKLVNKR
jgi:choice-of-anchor C domain-containing protein